MKNELTQAEDKLRHALIREATKQQHPIAPDRCDIYKKTWVIGRSKTTALLLEGRLAKNVWSGDMEITFRRFSIRLPKEDSK